MADGSLNDKLCRASARGNLAEVLLMLQNGAEVNGFNMFKRTALQVVMLGNTALVEALLEAGADLSRADPVLNLSVIHDAAREGFVDTVRALMQHGADVNVADALGNLPLHLASREGHLEVVKLVIEHTENPQKPNDLGYTAGQLAHFHKRKNAAEYIDVYLSSH